MNLLRVENLFVAFTFVMVLGMGGWSLLDGNDAFPRVSSAGVVMDRPSASEPGPAAGTHRDLEKGYGRVQARWPESKDLT